MILRQIDNKFSIETDSLEMVKTRIIKSGTGEAIPDDEPLFLLRARDKLAIPLLLMYKILCEQDNCTMYQMDMLEQSINKFALFKKYFPERMKQPGITRGL